MSHFAQSQSEYNPKPFQYPSNWEPNTAIMDKDIQKLLETNRRALRTYSRPRDPPDNLSVAERQALNELRQHPNIIIKPADKGSKIVILDRNQYLVEANKQLSDSKYYKKIPHSLQLVTQTKLRKIITSLYDRKVITAKQKYFLFGPNNPRPRQFYLLPKIHKEPQTWTVPFEVPAGRPIVSDCESTSYNVSQYLDHFLGPVSMKHPSYIKDTYHFLDLIRPMMVPAQAQLFTIDIDSLYTNIDTESGLRAIGTSFNKYPDRNRPDREIIALLEICLNNNDFVFNNQHFLQIHGTAMGQRYAPSYANIYMANWEQEALEKCTLKPLVYLRYLDDIFGIWTHDVSLFPEFINTLNNHHPSIKVKYTLDTKQVNFLDTTVFLQETEQSHKSILTKVYFKPTDTHALLHKASYHPKHTFKGLVKSQIIRFHRISSRSTDLQEAIGILFRSLRQRGYSKRYLRDIKNSTLANLSPPNNVHDRSTAPPNPAPALGDSGEQAQARQLIPFISTFSHRITALHRTVKNNFRTFQTQNPTFQGSATISAYRKNKSLRDILVRSTFTDHKPITQDIYTRLYKHRKYIHNRHSNTSYPVLGSFTLNTSNIVYIITCTSCHKHYVGETKHSLIIRLKQHLYYMGEGRLTTPLVQHFQEHSIDNLIISGLESNDHWTTGQRKRAERIWIATLVTTVPRGLNAN